MGRKELVFIIFMFTVLSVKAEVMVHASDLTVWYSPSQSFYDENLAEIDEIINILEDSMLQIETDFGFNYADKPIEVHIRDIPGVGAATGGGVLYYNVDTFSKDIFLQTGYSAHDWLKGVVVGEFVNAMTGQISSGWPSDWWVNGVWYFPGFVVVKVLDEIGYSDYSVLWEDRENYLSIDGYLFFKDVFDLKGWSIFQDYFSSVTSLNVDWNDYGSNPSKDRSVEVLRPFYDLDPDTLIFFNNRLTSLGYDINASDFSSVDLDSQPVVAYSYIVSDLTVNFDSSVVGGDSPFLYYWSFGDSLTSTSQSPVHVFSEYGIYEVLLSVSDVDGDVVNVTNSVVLVEQNTIPPIVVVDNLFLNGDFSNGLNSWSTVVRDSSYCTGTNVPKVIDGVLESYSSSYGCCWASYEQTVSIDGLSLAQKQDLTLGFADKFTDGYAGSCSESCGGGTTCGYAYNRLEYLDDSLLKMGSTWFWHNLKSSSVSGVDSGCQSTTDNYYYHSNNDWETHTYELNTSKPSSVDLNSTSAVKFYGYVYTCGGHPYNYLDNVELSIGEITVSIPVVEDTFTELDDDSTQLITNDSQTSQGSQGQGNEDDDASDFNTGVVEETYTGYAHYCNKFSLEKDSKIDFNFKLTNINDSYLRYVMVGLDCPEVNDLRVYTSNGCVSCKGGGSYCNLGVVSNFKNIEFTESFKMGYHEVCLWTTSIKDYHWSIDLQKEISEEDVEIDDHHDFEIKEEDFVEENVVNNGSIKALEVLRANIQRGEQKAELGRIYDNDGIKLKLAETVLKLESLKVKLSSLSSNSLALFEYYSNNGEEARALSWILVSSKSEILSKEIDLLEKEIFLFLYVKGSSSELDLLGVKEDIIEFKHEFGEIIELIFETVIIEEAEDVSE